MIVAKNCYFWSVFPQISCGGYPQNLSKFPKPHFLLTCTYFGGRRHGRNLPMAKATDGLAFGVTRHCRIEGLPPVPPTPLPVDDACCFAAYDGPKRKVGGSFGLGCSCERCCTSWAKAASRCPPSRCIFHPVATHPKRQNPSRIQAQRVAIWSTEPVPFGHLRTRSKQRWMDGAGRCGLGEFSIRWARMRNSRTPAGFRPNGLPLGRQSRCRLAPSNPLKAKADGWGWKLWQALVGLT